MKIFTPTQAKSASEERMVKDSIRARSIADTTRELLKAQTDAERDFDDMMKRQQEIAADFYRKSVEQKTTLENEVSQLEERRQKAISPLIEREKAIQSGEESLEKREELIGLKEAENEEESRILMARLDGITFKEQELDKRETHVKSMEKGAEIQRIQVAEDAKRLGIALAEFQAHCEEKENGFAYRQSELDADMNLYIEKDKKLAIREKEVKDEWLRIIDQRKTLERAFEEIRRSQQ